MTTAAKTTFGAVFKMDDTGGTPAAVAELTNIGPPEMSRGAENVTTHDSSGGAMEFIPSGVFEVGEIQIAGNLIAGTGADDLFSTALTGGTVQDFEILLKAASGTETWSGSAIVTNYVVDPLEVEGVQTFSATLKVTGALTQAPTV